MKLCVSHYDYKGNPGAEFKSGSSFSFGDRSSQNFT